MDNKITEDCIINQYFNISIEILGNKSLNRTDILLFCLIELLDKDKGCSANNNYFAKVLDMPETYINTCINKLVEFKYLNNLGFDKGKRIIKINPLYRKIYSDIYKEINYKFKNIPKNENNTIINKDEVVVEDSTSANLKTKTANLKVKKYLDDKKYFETVSYQDEIVDWKDTKKKETKQYIKLLLKPNEKWPSNISKEEKKQLVFNSNINNDIICEYIKSMEYPKKGDFLTTLYWKTIAEHVKYKAKYKCICCGSGRNNNDSYLVAHHPNYNKHGLEHIYWRDLECICNNCHSEIHSSESKASLDLKIKNQRNINPKIIQIIDYWNSLRIIKHKMGSKVIKQSYIILEKYLDNYEINQIKQSMKRYKMLLSTKARYNSNPYKVSLPEFFGFNKLTLDRINKISRDKTILKDIESWFIECLNNNEEYLRNKIYY